MAISTLALEHEVSQMEDRLAQVKVRVEVEREQWKKTSRVGKHGTKWKGAAKPVRALSATHCDTHEAPDSPVLVSELDFTTSVMPLHWDALELAQYLQTCQLKNYAQVVIYEQITGKMLIDTAPGKLRHLFQDSTGPKDPNWKSFLHIVSDLHKQQKQMERSSGGKPSESNASGTPSSPPKGTPLFPLLSPRGPPLLMTSSFKGQAIAPNNRDDAPKSPRSTAPHRMGTQPMATCWTCGSRFPRPHKQQEATTKRARAELRTFCSKRCQEKMETNGDMSIAPTFSGSVQTTPNGGNMDEPLPGNHPQRLRKTVKHRSFSETPTSTRMDRGGMRKCQTGRSGNPDAFNFLHVSAQQSKDELPRPPAQQNKPQAPRRRVTTGATITGGGSAAGAGTSSSIRANAPDDLSLPLVLTNTSMLIDPISQGRQPRIYQLSKYKLDPVVFQATRATLGSTFYASAPGRRNVLVLQEFLTIKMLHHLSLTCRAWRVLVLHSPCADAIWGSQLLRTWSKSDHDDEFLQQIGVLQRPEKPFKMLRLLTRQLSRLVLENTKELLRPETWQLATIVVAPLAASPSKVPVQLYEQITLVFARNGEIVAVRAQELIRPLGEDRLLTDILQGLRSGTLSTIDCRRLRLFSATNRLNADEWRHLPQCHAAAVFVWPTSASSTESVASSVVWHQKLWRRMQSGLQQRLLGKDSVQLLLRGIEERHEPAHVLVQVEKFLTSAIGLHKQRPKDLRHPQHSPMRPAS